VVIHPLEITGLFHTQDEHTYRGVMLRDHIYQGYLTSDAHLSIYNSNSMAIVHAMEIECNYQSQ